MMPISSFAISAGFEQAADTFEDDDASGNDNQQSFDRGGNQLDLAMSERMPRILRLGGQIQAVQANEACRYVHNTLHRIGQDTDRIGQPESEEFAGMMATDPQTIQRWIRCLSASSFIIRYERIECRKSLPF